METGTMTVTAPRTVSVQRFVRQVYEGSYKGGVKISFSDKKISLKYEVFLRAEPSVVQEIQSYDDFISNIIIKVTKGRDSLPLEASEYLGFFLILVDNILEHKEALSKLAKSYEVGMRKDSLLDEYPKGILDANPKVYIISDQFWNALQDPKYC